MELTTLGAILFDYDYEIKNIAWFPDEFNYYTPVYVQNVSDYATCKVWGFVADTIKVDGKTDIVSDIVDEKKEFYLELGVGVCSSNPNDIFLGSYWGYKSKLDKSIPTFSQQ